MQGEDARKVQAAILALHRGSREFGRAAFRTFALDRVNEVVPFDSALWCRAFFDDGKVRIYSAHDERLPPGTIAAWRGLEDRDELGAMAFARLGETIIASPAKDVAKDPVLIAGLLERFDLAHFLTTCLVDPYTSLISAVTLTRQARSPRFTERDREAKAALTPHLVEAEVSCLLYHGLAAPPLGGASSAMAIADDAGMLEFANAAFAEWLAGEWPGWSGPRLPAELRDDTGRPQRAFRGRGVIFRSERTGPASHLLRIRPLQQIDQLTEREAEVARLIAAGSTNKEVGRRLQLSPITVRNHLSSILRKLGIAKRGELAAFAGQLT
jgi:DNA-binding CsgD family transcriptional regulator